jgi:hypothetical protein
VSWTHVTRVPEDSLRGDEATLGALPSRVQQEVRGSMALGVVHELVDPGWKDTDLAVALERGGRGWHVRVSWSPPAAA